MGKPNPFDLVCARIDGYSQKVIEIQRQLVAIPAVGPESDGQGERAKAELVKGMLQELGVDQVREFNAPDLRVPDGYRPNLLAKIFGKNRGKTVWVMAHLDVVPPGDLSKWESDPYVLKVDGDKLIGRGTEDNHQALVSALLAIKAIKEEGILPENSIGLAIVSDEETGSGFGLQYILDHHKEEFRRDDLIIVPDAGDPKGINIEIAEKSLLWLKIQTRGKQCHASTPELGNNAHRAAAHLIVELDSLYEIFSARDAMFDPPISTFEPTKKEANVPNINTIPGDDVIYLDCRVLPKYPLREVQVKIREMADKVERQFSVKIDVSIVQGGEAAPPTSPDAQVVRILSEGIRQVTGQEAKTIGIGGGTVAAIFRRAGLPAAVWGTIEDSAHQPNEYSRISNTLQDAKVLAYVMLQ